MTVKELIAELSKFDLNTRVRSENYTCIGGPTIDEIERCYLERDEYTNEEYVMLDAP